MITLYRPVLIETVEQAEALPIGTIALLWPDRPEAYENHAAVKAGPEDTSAGVPLWLVDSQGTDTGVGMVGWTALVPIEADEVAVIVSGGLERDMHGATFVNVTPDGSRRDYRRTEYHTRWEAVS